MKDDELIPVKGSQTHSRDPYSGAIVNTDDAGYKNAIKAHKRNKMKDARLKNCEESINNINKQMSEMMKMMQQLMEK